MKQKRSRQRIKVSSAKAKGRGYQQKIRDAFKETARILGREDLCDRIESRQMGGAGEDVIFHGQEAQDFFGYYVETKSHRCGANPHAYWEDLAGKARAKTTANGFLIPLFFSKRDRGESLVTLSALEFFTFLLAKKREEMERDRRVKDGLRE